MAKKPRQYQGCYSSEHCSEHLCYIVSQGLHLETHEYQVVEVDGQYRCERCGRMALTPMRLCVPIRRAGPQDDHPRNAGDEPPNDKQ